MKKFLFVALLAILSVAVNAQTSGRVLVRDTSKYHPPVTAVQYVVDSASKTVLLWKLGTYNTVSVHTNTAGALTKGTATLVAGTVTVATTSAKTGSIILVTLNTPGGTQGTHYAVPAASITNNVSFVIRAVSTAGALVNTDVSTVNWYILN
jgi:hypothetical protein